MAGRTLACVVAHPDDDAYGVGGSVALHAADRDFRFVLIHASDGEGGAIPPGLPATRETLGRVRRGECASAWRAHGRPPDRHEWLGFPDGAVGEVPFARLVDAVATVLEQECPDVVVTSGPDGIFGHPDHIAIGAATDAAFLRFAGTDRPGFRRLVHGAIPQSVFERWNRQRAEQGLFVFDPSQTYHMRGVPDEQIGIEVDCRDVADRIVAGLLEHRSQLHVMSDDAHDTERWRRRVSREWGVLVWPPRTAGQDRLPDLFDGL